MGHDFVTKTRVRNAMRRTVDAVCEDVVGSVLT